ncbi:hypothetical protein ACQ4PT_052952 [Festuca glaucescens]
MALAKSLANMPPLPAYLRTSASCDPPLNSSWSECSSPRCCARPRKYPLSNTSGVSASNGARLLSPTPLAAGHPCWSCAANVALTLASPPLTRPRNVWQRARPTVCAPESAVMSRAESPLAANEASCDARLAPGPGRLALAAAWLAVRASFRPSFTVQVGPPRRLTASRDASARTSAQETVALHAASTRALTASTASKPRRDPRFGPAAFSAVSPGASSRRTEPSQPLTKQSWKKRRRTEAPVRGSAATACAIADRTAGCRPGHVLS